MTQRRCLALLAALAFALGGCATAVGIGQTALREGRYVEAASNFESALKEHPGRTDALVGLGLARYGQERYDEAVILLRQAVAQDPKLAEAWLYLGLAFLERGDNDSAVENLRAFRDLSRSARMNRQVDHALELIRTEHTLSPQSRRFVAMSLEHARKSEQELQDARSAYPTGPYNDLFVGRWTW